MNTNKSEVARLLNQITNEYEAAKRGLSGTASGTARHNFIATRMENMGKLQNQLEAIMGEGEGTWALIVDALNDLPDQAVSA